VKLLNKVRSGVGFLPNLVARKTFMTQPAGASKCWECQQRGAAHFNKRTLGFKFHQEIQKKHPEKNTHITTPKKRTG